ncbi:probable aminopeptidase NPEPL1 isoform X2 [Plutella xylostella]|uniref:probable aminopeptidase NPEPL1 isoform X2 n=1 Tax=Plutella xylostella TaxID=51655 RepID=UPI0020325012|nr:probable aminopeptidase NPEPL1 isoform X2 [Plutella xylostella]
MILRSISTCMALCRNNAIYVSIRNMSNGSGVSVKFTSGLSKSDPEQKPVLIVGQASHLATLTWQDVRCKLEPRVTEDAWRRGISIVTASPGESCELWPGAATLATLPARRSRHAAPSRAHALAKIVRGCPRQGDEDIVLVCRKRDAYASAIAIARSFPLYSARTTPALLAPAPAPAPAAKQSRTVNVEIVLAKENEDGDTEDDGPLDPYLTDGTLSPQDTSTIQEAADATRLAARLTDAPANIVNVSQIIEEAVKVAKELGIPEPTVIRGEELKARGMGGIYGVGRAAEDPPALVVLSYVPPGATETVAWVGKGIVYDTGGLSIKTAMVGMKGDMGGAAGVLGALRAAVRAAPAAALHAVLCVAENAVGPRATRPDDIHTLYSGRTVEINNTDAEGRLVLSDGVVYASRDLKADIIVDMATLTGAQGIATGKYHAAIISNCPSLESRCVRAGRGAGELAHALPFAPELHHPEFSSQVADMKNSCADRNNAQPSCAGLFILSHLGFDTPARWLHVDMAAPAHCGERATGYGVGLLTVLFGDKTQSKLLRALCPK